MDFSQRYERGIDHWPINLQLAVLMSGSEIFRLGTPWTGAFLDRLTHHVHIQGNERSDSVIVSDQSQKRSEISLFKNTCLTDRCNVVDHGVGPIEEPPTLLRSA